MSTRDQYYVFQAPGTQDAWCEMFFRDVDGTERHITAPTPFFGPDAVARAEARLQAIHPDALVDQLQEADIRDAMRFTMAAAR